MATAKPKAKANDAELNLDLEVPKQSKVKLLLIILLLLLVLGAAGGAAWWFLIHKKAPAAEGEDEAASEEPAPAVQVAPVKVETVYLPLEEPLVSNIRSESGKERILLIKLTFVLTKATDIELVNSQMPAVKAALLSVFGAVTAEALQQPESMEQLRTQALQTLRARLVELIGAPTVEKMLFTSFLMQ